MQSGVQVADQCINAFNELKLKKKYRYLQLRLNDDNTQIIVENAVEVSGTGFDEEWKEFVEQLPNNDCRFIIYDYSYNNGEDGKRDYLIFIYWCGENASIRKKMTYSSTKDTVKNKLEGIRKDFHAVDASDLTHSTILEKLGAKLK